LSENLRKGEDVNIHEYCCGMGVAAEQLQLLLNALSIAAGTRNRARVVGSDVSPLNEARMNPRLDLYHEIALDYLEFWNIEGIDVDALRKEQKLTGPQAKIITASADDRIEHPGPLDFAFCIHGIWYVDDKLAMIYNMVDSLRQKTGLALLNALAPDSICIACVRDGEVCDRYSLQNFLNNHGNQQFKFHKEDSPPGTMSSYTLSAQKTNPTMGHMPQFIESQAAFPPNSGPMGDLWDYAKFRRATMYAVRVQ